ncbi:NlpC/P60 family protein [Streptantibioticus rubrisoli]|uniref:NlpC/P60 family protein n=1 Tax=Streptantibioticus rubrisoli TaxID=1387313 RepID=A0ABT1PNT7_9ACTN|nr:C40 family peptidase [Streptantibioticus rubrisoli]MCQ4046248.1 NlpC/P60 family protein [Streptantibioticus rubrisoli]
MAIDRRPARPGLVRATRFTVLSAAAMAAAVSGTLPAGAAPQNGPDELRSRVNGLYQQAEQATEKYDAAQERAARLRGELDDLQGELARSQAEVNRLRDALGKVAGAQYRDGGVDPALALLLSSDPGDYLDRAATLDRVDSRRAGQLHALRDARRILAQRHDQAAAKLAELDRLRRTLEEHKRTVQGKLAEAQRLLAALPTAQRDAIGFGAAANNRTGSPGPGSAPGSASGSASDPVAGLADLGPLDGRAAEAVAAARAALGSPYAWGSTGPGAFDCSGLMYWAYQHAGMTLPRTSQEQLSAGHHVPLSQARPGDLVIYRSDASHVGMYVGGGKVIHAPYPGARVRYDPVDMMPVAAVVRP